MIYNTRQTPIILEDALIGRCSDYGFSLVFVPTKQIHASQVNLGSATLAPSHVNLLQEPHTC